MSKISKISGFQEWLPYQKLHEDKLISSIRQVYESYGFVPIETAAVERVGVLEAKGSVDKEIFAVRRIHAEEGEEESIALHFDLTVPFARYVAQNFNEITFPFKRYQCQKVWRGERPQKGRSREFYQFDIDVIGREELPLASDADVLSAFCEALQKLGLPKFTVRVNSRKILHGYYESLGLAEDIRAKTISAVDKLNKIGEAGVLKALCGEVGLDQATAEKVLSATQQKYTVAEFVAGISSSPLPYQQGVDELRDVLKLLPESVSQNVSVDMSLARGLDYYTGLICEVVLDDYPEYGSIGAGGRYEDLASEFINQKLPGVGFSIGLTRIMGVLIDLDRIPKGRKVPTQVLVTVLNEEQRVQCTKLAQEFRIAGIPTEVFFKSSKLGKQIDYAATREIPYVAFLNAENRQVEIKNLSSKEQQVITSVASWAAELKR